MDGIFSFLKDASESFGGATSFSDRLNSKYSALILVIFALLTTTRQYISEPISCWCPSDFTEEQVDYVNKVRRIITNTNLYPTSESKPNPNHNLKFNINPEITLIEFCKNVIFFH